ncbi:unnamed protein product [Penicillium manginii]
MAEGPADDAPHPTEPRGRCVPLLPPKEELENARLRDSQLAGSDDSFLTQSTSSLSPTSPRQTRVASSTPQDGESLRSNCHPEVPDSDHNRRATSLYHGPTSAAYDDRARSGEGVGNIDLPNDPASEDWSRNLLFVQTARQSRQETFQ